MDDENDNDFDNGNLSDDNIDLIRTLDNGMDRDPDDISDEWQKVAAMHIDMKATLFQFMGLHRDTFTIDQKTDHQLLDLIQWEVSILFPHKKFVVTRSCTLYHNVSLLHTTHENELICLVQLRQAVLSWCGYFLKAATRYVSGCLQRKKLARCTDGIALHIHKKKKHVIEWVHKITKNSIAFYKTPNSNPQVYPSSISPIPIFDIVLVIQLRRGPTS